MAEQAIQIHRFENGLTLLAEAMDEVSSAAFTIMTPGGVARDPESRTGTASVLGELLFRGAGEMDNRALNERLDSLGLQRSVSVGLEHMHFSGALVGENLLETLEVYGDVLTRPHLENEPFKMCRQLAMQTLASYDDDPRQKISLLVHEDYLPYPLGRPSPGKMDELEQLTVDEIKAFWQRSFTPSSTIIAAAGKIDFEALKATVGKCFGSWQGEAAEKIVAGDCSLNYHHHENDGAQVHIGVMYPSVGVTHKDYYKALVATSVLSGGMGSRLFTEVREKRALCYAVAASHRVLGTFGAVQCYLGSSPEQAQEGLDVMLGELKKLGQGISQDELDRAIVGLRASLIMMGESTNARAGRLSGDYYHLGRVRSLNEIEQAISGLSVADVLDHVNAYTPKKFSVTTLGPTKLTVA